MLINHSLNALSSTHKNTTLGDTCFKGSPANASESSDVEESPVDSTIEGHQDNNKSNQGSPVSVKEPPPLSLLPALSQNGDARAEDKITTVVGALAGCGT